MKKAIIAGAGVMGASLAQVYAKAGYSVTVYDIAEKFLEKGKDLCDINQAVLVKEEMVTEEESKAIKAAITYTCDKECFKATDTDIILETIIEKIEIKQDFWEEVSRMAPETCLLATNTSGLHISDISEKMVGKDRFIGQHWLNPPHLLPLCELIVGKDTSPETVEKMKELVIGLDKKPVVVKDINGFIINRLQFAILRESLYIVESGSATMEDIDNVMKYGLGLRYAALGPFLTADLGGLDTFDKISGYLFDDLSTQKGHNDTLHNLALEGNFGVKSGKGFYDYSDGKDVETIKHRDEMFIKLAKCLYQ